MYAILALLLLTASGFDNPERIATLEQQALAEPTNSDVRLDLVETFIDQENFPEALRYLKQIDSLMTNSSACNARYYFLRGKYYDESMNIPKAAEYYKLAVKCDSTYSRAWRNLAYLHDIFAKYDEMLFCLQQALHSTADSGGVLYDLGVTYDYLDSIEQAIECYNRSLQYGDIYPQTYLNLGVDWGMTGHGDSAYYYFTKAADAGLESPELYYNLGVIMSEWGASEEAMNNFMRTLTIDPEYSPAKLQLGYIYESLGDSGMARVYFEEFTATAPPIYAEDVKKIKAKLAKDYGNQ